jgi:nucleotide-binding universal stress UspA family protein
MAKKKRVGAKARTTTTKPSSRRPARAVIAPPVKLAILATDLSPAALGAVEAAKFVREALRAEVVIVYVAPTSDISSDERKAWRERVKGEIEQFAIAHGLGGSTIVVDEGDPAQCAIEAANKHRADLVIVGRRGEHGLKQKVLGTTSRRLVRKCPVSVLVARREFGGVVERVGASTDFSPGADLAIRRAAALTIAAGMPGFDVLHAVDEPSGAFAAFSHDEFIASRRSVAEERVTELVGSMGLGSGLSARLRVGEGRTAETLASMSKSRRLDILCVGAHGAGGTAMLLGSTAERLIDLASCSVWIEKSREDQRTLVERLARLIG